MLPVINIDRKQRNLSSRQGFCKQKNGFSQGFEPDLAADTKET
jgi:hypothetical protein